MRTAQQILEDAQAGKLESGEIKIKETARLTIRDVVTGEVEERILSHEQPRTLRNTSNGLELTDFTP